MKENMLRKLVILVSLVFWYPNHSLADDPNKNRIGKAFEVDLDKQEMLELVVEVSDMDANPVKGAKITPWALRSSLGHGEWSGSATECEPETATTGKDGKAIVRFPKFAYLKEQVKTTAISVSVSRPDHPKIGSEHIEIGKEQPHDVFFPRGSAIEAAVTIDGKEIGDDEILAMWTGGVSSSDDSGFKRTEDKTFRIPPLAKGTGEFMFVRFENGRPTHFSRIEKFEIDAEEPVIRSTASLVPAVSVRGKLSENVPRPVENGRVVVRSITEGESWDELNWFTWAEVQGDGTFQIDAWPADTPIQLAALCDGFIGKSGEKPPMVKPERAKGGHLRAQVFLTPDADDITVEMTEMAICNIEVENAFGKKLRDVDAFANPNIGWWNGGSQIYGWPLVRGADYLSTGNYHPNDGEGLLAMPFRRKSDKDGKLTMELPVGRAHISVGNKRYQLPAKMGRRTHSVSIKDSSSFDLKLVLQPVGLDVLGDWEDLCGLVFG